jgi:hypothetical protein
VALKRELRRGIEMKRDFTLDLLASKEYDFIYVLRSCTRGYFFTIHDRKHPVYGGGARARELAAWSATSLGPCVAQFRAAQGHGRSVVVGDRGMIANHRGDQFIDDTPIARPRDSTRQDRRAEPIPFAARACSAASVRSGPITTSRTSSRPTRSVAAAATAPPRSAHSRRSTGTGRAYSGCPPSATATCA